MIPIGYTFAVAALTIVFGIVIHLAYKRWCRSKGYNGITLLESLFILVGSVPGIAGCASGWAGFGIPLPLIVGLPIHILLIFDSKCGWMQSLYYDDPYLMHKFKSFTVAWFIACVLLIIYLYLAKLYKSKSGIKKQ